MVSALNRMIDDVNNGKTVFYDFYTEHETKQQRTKSNTGLFFFRGNLERPARSFLPAEASPMSHSSMNAFPTLSRSAGRDITRSS